MQTKSVLKWSLIAGIVIVLNLFFGYATSLVYEEPDFEAFCPQQQVNIPPDNQDACIAEGGQWTENVYSKPIEAAPQYLQLEPRGYCDLQFTCRQEHEDARRVYERNIFIVLVALGAISVVAGNLLTANYVIAQSLPLAGVLSFIIASFRYWGSADNLIRVIILAIALILLFWIAYKKFKNESEQLR